MLWLVVGWCWLTAVWPPWWLPVPLVVTTLVVPLTLADLRHRRLPDVLTLPAYPLVGAAVLVAGLSGPGVEIMRRACVAGAVFGGAHLLVHALSRRALGGGDVKLAGALGVALGAVGWVALLVAAALAGVVSVFLSFVPRWRYGVPHGPGLSIAAWLLTVFPGPQPEVMR
ncbi:MAG TPA: A24 family peptidase [Amycolatopsis sp.]|nr:A24 family peptidase [Amycolatopsis sp.]